MIDLDASWDAYARLQKQSFGRKRMDAHSWGIEAGLDHLLSLIESDTPCNPDEEAERAVDRGRARERHRWRLQTRLLSVPEEIDPQPMLDDRARLREALSIVGSGDRDRDLLIATGLGHDSADIANDMKIKPASLRKRVERMRIRLTEAA